MKGVFDSCDTLQYIRLQQRTRTTVPSCDSYCDLILFLNKFFSLHMCTQRRCLTQVWVGTSVILKQPCFNYSGAAVCLTLADTAVLSNTHRITRSSPKLCLFCSMDSFWCCFSGCPFSTVVPLSSWSSWELIPSCISRISCRRNAHQYCCYQLSFSYYVPLHKAAGNASPVVRLLIFIS